MRLGHYDYPEIPTGDELFFFTVKEDNPERWVEELQGALNRKFICQKDGNKLFVVPELWEILDTYIGGGPLRDVELIEKSMREIVSRKYGDKFFSIKTKKLYDNEGQMLFETERSFLRDQLKSHGIHGSWEWIFLPFLGEKWLEKKKEKIFSFLKKINIPLKDKGIRVIPHDSVGYHGPDQVSMMTEILSHLDASYDIDASTLNNLGNDIFFIKEEGEMPKMHTHFYREWVTLEITRLEAADKEYETNIPINYSKLKELKALVSKSEVRDRSMSTFGNTGEPSLALTHPEMDVNILGNVSRSFLKKYAASYESVGKEEYVHLYKMGYRVTHNFQLWE